jgi:hypothetical protein
MSTRAFQLLALCFPAVLLLAGCGGSDRDPESYHEGNGAVQLESVALHRGGYGRSDCLVCHNVELNVHRTPEVPLDIEAINENARKEGASSCQVCHGGNGT